jgi:hypothetical protein
VVFNEKLKAFAKHWGLLPRPLAVDLGTEDEHAGLPIESDLASGKGAAQVA